MFQRFFDEGLAQSSFLIVCPRTRQAAVVDPRRDVDIYVAAARQHGLTIAWAIETHVHADFVSGARELAAAGARVIGGPGAGLQFPWHEARDGEIRVPILTRTLDSFELPEVDFLKIDVEGHEVQVLAGARDTLRRCRPIVLIEARPENLATVEQILGGCGLRPVAGKDAGVQLTPGNYLFREAESVGLHG